MNYGVVPLHPEHLDKLLEGTPLHSRLRELRGAYFTPGSIAFCLIYDGEPVFAGGCVNLQWNRAEAWILPTKFFRSHLKTCLKEMRMHLPLMAGLCGFHRIQATCTEGISGKLFRHLGFHFEGMMLCFGPNGENCSMFSRIFEVAP